MRDPFELCTTCQAVYKSSEIDAAGGCPECAGQQFTPTVDPLTGADADVKAKGRPTTLVLSPLEIAFPNSYARFDDLPYIIRLRWRTRRYFESNQALAALIPQITWEKSPSDENLNLFNSLSQHNDLGVASGYMGEIGSSSDEDGIAEYEVWMKPTMTYPDGLVFRVYGSNNPIVAHLEDQEGLPGKLPYADADGSPLFTFAHAGFEHVGGRIIASGPLDAIIQKQDQLNQLDSMILLIIQRMSNPVWLTPKGAEISKFTGMPGLVLKWNPLTVGGNAKPERIAGEGPNAALFTVREQYLKDIEDLAGTYDIIKGAKPTGVEAFSSLQLLVERSQSRFAGVFQARGDAYKNWFKLEREFGPDERTKAILSPNRNWTFETFKKAQLQGSISVVVEDGSTVPKTNLGMRAAIEHANSLGMLNMQDPDQQYEGLKLFGITRMVPTLDIHVQAALQKQQSFEEWILNPDVVKQFAMQAAQKHMEYQQQLQQAAASPDLNAPIPQAPSALQGSPLEWRPWYNPVIHKQECMKWANSDKMRELFKTNPAAVALVTAHLQEIDQHVAEIAMQQAAMSQGQTRPGGASKAMQNSNKNSGKSPEAPKGEGESAQKPGAA